MASRVFCARPSAARDGVDIGARTERGFDGSKVAGHVIDRSREGPAEQASDDPGPRHAFVGSQPVKGGGLHLVEIDVRALHTPSSVAVDPSDVRRAREGADLLARILKAPVIAVVIGQYTPDPVLVAAHGTLGRAAASPEPTMTTAPAAPSRLPRRRWRTALLVVAGLLVIAAAAFVGWASTARPADPEALTAAAADPEVEVTEVDGRVIVRPADGTAEVGVVFYPGARVAPAAYVATWAPVVAATGVEVHIPAMPLNLAVLAPQRAADVIAAEPGIARWWIGGHSLGGAMAGVHAGAAAPGTFDGVILWASFTTERAGLAARDDLLVASITGSRDGLSTPARIAERRDRLPAAALVTEIDGMNHAQFGRYGPQRGDLPAMISDTEAQAALTAATVAALDDG